MTVDTEKMKALALAATPGPWAMATDWDRAAVYSETQMVPRYKDSPINKRVVCSGNQNNLGHYKQEHWSGADWHDAAYIAAANPAAVLELIAEIERERAARAPWYLVACKMGNALYNLGQHDDLPEQWKESCAALVKEWDDSRKGIGLGSAPAAGTDKDAERYRKLFEIDDFCRDPLWPVVDWMRGTVAVTKEEVDAALDSVGAHTKAGKEPPEETKVQVLPAEWAPGQPAIAPGMVEVQENYDRAQLQALGQHQEKP